MKHVLDINNDWFSVGAYSFHRELFKRGLIVVNSNVFPNKSLIISKEKFNFNGNEYRFHTIEIDEGNDLNVRKTFNLLIKIIRDIVRNESNSKLSAGQNSIAIVNSNQKEEIFLPLVVKDKKQEFGLYLHPWQIESEVKLSFYHFDKFFTTGSLFGPYFLCMPQPGWDTIRRMNQYRMNFDSDSNVYLKIFETGFYGKDDPYKEMLFYQLKSYAFLINKITQSNESKFLLYHLPDYDCVLFGLDLYLRGKMELKALGKFYIQIFHERERDIKKIRGIFNKYNIKVWLQSPFENLFEDFFKTLSEITDPLVVSAAVISKLEIQENQVNNDARIDAKEQPVFLKYCLEKLSNSKFNENHAKVWKDFVNVKNLYELAKIEDLLEVGKTVMLALAGRGHGRYKTCSLLPLSEKQTQIKYVEYCKNFAEKINKSTEENLYPAIFNITTLETILAYDHNSEGSISNILTRMDLPNQVCLSNLINYAYRNIGIFTNAKKDGNKPIELDDVFSGCQDRSKVGKENESNIIISKFRPFLLSYANRRRAHEAFRYYKIAWDRKRKELNVSYTFSNRKEQAINEKNVNINKIKNII